MRVPEVENKKLDIPGEIFFTDMDRYVIVRIYVDADLVYHGRKSEVPGQLKEALIKNGKWE